MSDVAVVPEPCVCLRRLEVLAGPQIAAAGEGELLDGIIHARLRFRRGAKSEEQLSGRPNRARGKKGEYICESSAGLEDRGSRDIPAHRHVSRPSACSWDK